MRWGEGPEQVRLSPEILDFWSHYRTLPQNGGRGPHLTDYLDSPPYHLQPRVAIADVTSPTEMRVRLYGSGLVELTGRDVVGNSNFEHHSPAIRALSGRYAWDAACRPCGYVTARAVTSKGGGIYQTQIITLPLNLKGEGRCLVNFMASPMLDMTTPQAANSALFHSIAHLMWIDLGAGTPDAPPSLAN